MSGIPRESALPPRTSHYIAIEGVIGAGKTTLARRLAHHLGAHLLLEKPADNPFLADFYADMAEYALPTQFFFLFQRVQQLEHAQLASDALMPTVSDFTLAKDPIFAHLTLTPAELALYRRAYDHLHARTRRPDLVIYLQASAPTLLERIAKRGIAMERAITADYLARLSATYEAHFAEYSSSPIITVDAETSDLTEAGNGFKRLLEQIHALQHNPAAASGMANPG